MSKVLKTAHDFEKKWRSDDVVLKEKTDFSAFHLQDRVLVGLKNAGYKTPSPIQALAIPAGLFGNDLLVQAKSGTGKTLVFTVIALQTLLDIKYPQILIMVPTREIAVQVRDCIRAVGSGIKGLKCHAFIGGLPVADDEENIIDCQIVVGTPGRLKQLVSIGFLKTNSIRVFVLDEADTLIENVFITDLNYIFQSLPKFKQVIATSATYPKELKTFIRHYFKTNVRKVRLNKKDLSLLGMVHYIKTVEHSKLPLVAYKTKLSALEIVLTTVRFTQCLVFCNLKSMVESLCCDIRTWGFTTTYISADKEQHARLKAIDNLKRFRCKVLVTSDVTARGIDAENVDLVVNFDKPFKEETYFHRCGRAGRYGSKGVAVTFLFDDEVHSFKTNIENKNFQVYFLPEPVPELLINIRPKEKEPTENDSKVEELDNSLNVISGVSNQNECKVTSKKENDVPKTKKIVRDEKIEPTDKIESDLDSDSSEFDDTLLQCVNLVLNGVSSNNSEEICTDVTAESCPKTDCKSEVNELHLKSTGKDSVAKNIVNRDTVEKKTVDENSDNLIKEHIAKDLEQQEESGVTEDSSLNGLSRLSSDISCESETLNTVLEQVKETSIVESDSEVKSIQTNEKLEESGSEKTPVSAEVVSEVNNLCQTTVPDSSQTEPVKVPQFSKLQNSLAKFLVDYEVKYDPENLHNLNQLEASHDSLSSGTREKETFPFKCDSSIAEKCKNIRKDLASFYHKIYKAYQVQVIDEVSFKDFKAGVMAQEKVKENDTSEINRDKTDVAVDKHISSETLKSESTSNSKKVTETLPGKKVDVDSDSSDSSDSTSSKHNLQSSLNVGDQTFANYIFKGPLASKSIPEENSDSESHLNDTINKVPEVSNHLSTSSESEESFCSSSKKLRSKVCKVLKSPSEDNVRNHSMPSKTLLKQEVDTSKNSSVKKKVHPKKNYAKNKNSSKIENGPEGKSSSYSQRHNGARPKNVKIFHRNTSPNRSDSDLQGFHKSSNIPKNQEQKTAFRNKTHGNSRSRDCKSEGNSASYPYTHQYHESNRSDSDLQGFNKSSNIPKNQEQKTAFRNKTHRNSRSRDCRSQGNSASYPYTHQYHEYFPTAVCTNQVPVLQSGYSNPHCSCCMRNISHNNTPNDWYSIFLKQWEFINNLCYPKH